MRGFVSFAIVGSAGLTRSTELKWTERKSETLDAAVGRLLSHRASAAAIGRAYLAVSPGEASADRLRALFAPGITAEELAAQVQTDFSIGRIVVIKGWALSLTEARACALVALT